MDVKQIILKYARELDVICAKLNMAVKSDAVSEDVSDLTCRMEKEIQNSSDEMLCAALYNARATVMTAPKGCSVAQLKDALCDAGAELLEISEYLT